MPRDIQEPSKTYSQTQGYGMVPVYDQQTGRGGERGTPVFLGYEFNPIAAGLKKEDAPKPAGVLAEEKRLGTTMEPLYQTYTEGGGGRRGGGESVEYGPPIGYRYDNGHSQYVNFDANGQYQNTANRSSDHGFGDLLKIAALAGGAYFLGPVIGSLFGKSAVAAGAAEGLAGAGAAGTALTPAAIESLVGTAGYGVNASALEAAAAAGIPASAVGANALSQIPGATTSAVFNPANTGTPLGDIANLTGSNVNSLEPVLPPTATPGTPPPPNVGPPTPLSDFPTLPPTATPGTPPPPNVGPPTLPPTPDVVPPIPSGPPSTPGTPPPPDVGPPGSNIPTPTPTLPPTATPGTPPPPDVGPPGTNIPTSVPIDPSLLQKLKDATGLTGTQLAALLSGGVNAATALNTSGAIGAGLKAQQDATKASQDVLKGVYDTQLGFQKPYQGTGINALNQMGQLGSGTYQMYDPVTGQPTTMGAGSGYLTHQFDKNDLTSGLAPNYDFMLQQGQMANQRAANVGGGALSGNTLQGLQNYTQNYAGNAYQNAFQNYQTQRNNIYNNLSNMAGIGTDANKQASSAGTSYGTNISNLNIGLGNATAAAMLGQAQAAGGGANAAANAAFLAALLNQGVKTPPP